MSYEPTNWKTGDVVTSAKLNKLENAVAGAGGVLVVNINNQSGALDKTWQEIHDALMAGYYVSIPFTEGASTSQILVLEVEASDGYNVYGALFGDEKITFMFSTDSTEGYPVHQNEPEGGGIS